MSPTTPPAATVGPATGRVWHRAAPVLCGGALAAAGAYVAATDPSAAGRRFPACQFRAVTGLWCPGCGLTRGTHELLRGDIGAALGHNLFVPVALAAIVVAWWAWTRRAWSGVTPAWATRVAAHLSTRAMAIGLPAVIVVYGVLRNIPAPPLRVLAP